MATSHTVPNDFNADDPAIADDVDANFNAITAYLDDMDASNIKKSGTYVPIANISGLTSTQMASAFFKDEDDMASDSATAVASQQSVKAYADAIDPTYAGGQSHTFGGGLIIKMGVDASVGANSVTTITFDDAFPNAAVSAGVTLRGSVQGEDMVAPYCEVAAATIKLVNDDTTAHGMYWFAIGY